MQTILSPQWILTAGNLVSSTIKVKFSMFSASQSKCVIFNSPLSTDIQLSYRETSNAGKAEKPISS